MGAESHPYALPAELDTYMQESIFNMLGFGASEDHLSQKLSKAEESYQDHASQLQHVQIRLRELEYKRCKSKEEAVMNAQALKRQVAESQKLAEQYRTLREECNKLEQECALYHNDRDVFMEAAYEAEDRAAEAEDRAAEAERKNGSLFEELEEVRHSLGQAGRVTLEMFTSMFQMDYTDYVASLKLRIAELEEQNSRLQEVWAQSFEGQQPINGTLTEVKLQPNNEAALQAILMEAKEKCEQAGRELESLQEKYDQEVALRKDEQEVNRMVSSAVTAGICKAIEEEKEDALKTINLQFSDIFKNMESDLGGRLKHEQALLHETRALREEANLCRGNLDKAEIEVQMLADENKILRALLGRKHAGPESPMQNKGNKGGRSLSGGRSRPKKSEGQGEDVCVLCNARQPLMPLPANSLERKLNRRQNLTVDGNFCSRSPSLSPSLELSPGSIFQD